MALKDSKHKDQTPTSPVRRAGRGGNSFDQSTTANGDFIITKEKRQQLRELQLHPKPVNLGRGPNRNGPSLSEKEREVYHMDVVGCSHENLIITLSRSFNLASSSNTHSRRNSERVTRFPKAWYQN
jgi:hypothetical protein